MYINYASVANANTANGKNLEMYIHTSLLLIIHMYSRSLVLPVVMEGWLAVSAGVP